MTPWNPACESSERPVVRPTPRSNARAAFASFSAGAFKMNRGRGESARTGLQHAWPTDSPTNLSLCVRSGGHGCVRTLEGQFESPGSYESQRGPTPEFRHASKSTAAKWIHQRRTLFYNPPITDQKEREVSMYTVWGLVDANGIIRNGSKNPSTNLHNFEIVLSDSSPGIFFVQFNPWFAGIPAVFVQHVAAIDGTFQTGALCAHATVESVTQYVAVVATGDDS